MPAKKPIFIVDASAIMFRSFYGLAPLRTSTGIPTQAVYGFYKAIKKMLSEFGPDRILLAWDSKQNIRRDKLSSYKANRAEFPDELAVQRTKIIEIARLMGLAQLELPGYEADDIIFAATKKFGGHEVVIVSSDKDLFQLIDERVKQFDPAKDKLFDAQGVEDKFGFGPGKIAFYHSLVGDASDNIPGARGIGAKTATELVTQFNSLDDLYANLDKVAKPRTRKLLEEGREQVLLSQDLFALIDCPVDLSLEDLKFDPESWAKANSVFRELEMSSFVVAKAAPKAAAGSGQLSIGQLPAAAPTCDYPWLKYKTITTQDELAKVVARAKELGVVALDLETTGFDWQSDQIVGVSLATDCQEAYYVPLRHKDEAASQLDPALALECVKSLVQDESVTKVLQNAKFDLHFLKPLGIELRGGLFDTMIAARLVRPEWQRVDLSTLAMDYLDIGLPAYKDCFASFADFSHVPVAQAAPYGAADALCAIRLKEALEAKVAQDGSQKLFQDIESPLVKVILDMEDAGIIVCPEELAKIEQEIKSQLDSIQVKIRATLEALGVDNPDEINLLSPKQVEQLLFGVLGLEPVLKKKGGTRSTSRGVLDELAKSHPVPGMIAQYRQLSKLLGTYAQALPQKISSKTGRVHTTFLQTKVSTGRLSSIEPNLQNVPPIIRRAFVSQEGWSLVSADYSQIELRILAHVSGDPKLIDAFKKGLDVHVQTAEKIFNCPAAEVTKEQRQVAKRINFSVIYGLSAFSLAKELEVSRTTAQEYIDAFFAQYSGVRAWMDKVAEGTRLDGYTKTLFGRKRYFPAINDRNKAVSQAAERGAINSVVQGTASEIIKVAMVQLAAQIEQKGLEAKTLLQVHDELVFEVRDDQLKELEGLISQVMPGVVSLSVPMEVSIGSAKNWEKSGK